MTVILPSLLQLLSHLVKIPLICASSLKFFFSFMLVCLDNRNRTPNKTVKMLFTVSKKRNLTSVLFKIKITKSNLTTQWQQHARFSIHFHILIRWIYYTKYYPFSYTRITSLSKTLCDSFLGLKISFP